MTLDGKPLAGATIVFTPQKGRPASGVTDAQGRVTLSMSAKDEGVLPGVYRVSITANDSQDESNSDQPPTNRAVPNKPAIPAQYSDPGTSAMTAEVVSGPNVFEFELSGPVTMV